MHRVDDAPVDVFPEFAPPKVEIHTVAIGLAPTEVEKLVTVPLEQALNGVPGVGEIHSKSVEQLSQIVLLLRGGGHGTSSEPRASSSQERIATVTPTACPPGRRRR